MESKDMQNSEIQHVCESQADTKHLNEEHKTDESSKLSRDAGRIKDDQESLKLEQVSSTQHQRECALLNLKTWHYANKAFLSHLNLYGSSSYINLNLLKHTHFGFVKKMKSLTLPSLDRVDLFNIKFDRKNKDAFFKKCFPIKILNFRISLYCLTDASKLLLRLSRVSYKVIQQIGLATLIIDESQMRKLFMLVKHILRVNLSFCKLNFTKVIDLDTCLKGTAIEDLHIFSCGGKMFSDWVNKPDNCSKFIESLSKSDLKNSLKKVFVHEAQVERDFARQAILKSELKHVTFIIN
ncbi:unnamed protein product [Moneuplotes crassus]|uniref:Uncharacterized protein n=1 Tax=Euplotes crassus TaxID=5936 RepID=A0AAD1XJQ1_EUPCR|nr:unnamed protein product [Moneuplotes crassus]